MIDPKKVLMLVRREVWENRSLWIVPLVISAVTLLALALGGNMDGGAGIHFGHDADSGPDSSPESSSLSPFVSITKRQAAYAIGISGVTFTQLLVLAIMVFFYLLDSLLAERKDRSILFWKSLPISDAEVVTSKALTGLVLTPIYVLLVSAVTQILAGIVVWLRLSNTGIGDLIPAVDFAVWAKVQVAFWTLAPAVILWYLPLAAYLLLVSVWARKNAFLWAVLPPVAILLIEGRLLRSHHVAEFLAHRFVGVYRLLNLDSMRDSPGGSPLVEFIGHVGNVFVSYETWLGVLVAAVMFVAVVRIRRYRDDS